MKARTKNVMELMSKVPIDFEGRVAPLGSVGSVGYIYIYI